MVNVLVSYVGAFRVDVCACVCVCVCVAVGAISRRQQFSHNPRSHHGMWNSPEKRTGSKIPFFTVFFLLVAREQFI